MKKKVNSTRTFVKRNRTNILVTGLVMTTTLAILEHLGIRQHNDFLREHGLYDNFYSMID